MSARHAPSDPSWNLDRIRAHCAEGLPLVRLFGIEVIEAESGHARVRLPESDGVTRPGGTVAGPVLFAMADLAAYALILAAHHDPGAVTVDLTIHFLRPAHRMPLVCEALPLRAGRRLHIATMSIFSEAEPSKPVAHATATYAFS